jgi:hypothetical protein
MAWRPNEPSPTWRSFPRNYLTDLVAVDMVVVATATFRLRYAVIVLNHRRARHPLRYHPTLEKIAQHCVLLRLSWSAASHPSLPRHPTSVRTGPRHGTGALDRLAFCSSYVQRTSGSRGASEMALGKSCQIDPRTTAAPAVYQMEMPSRRERSRAVPDPPSDYQPLSLPNAGACRRP